MNIKEIRRYEFLHAFTRSSMSESQAREHAINCETGATDWEYINAPDKIPSGSRFSLSQGGRTEWQRLRNGFARHYGSRLVDIENSFHFEKWYRHASRRMDPLTLVVYAMRRIYDLAPVIEIGYMLNISGSEVIRRLRRADEALAKRDVSTFTDRIQSVIARYHELDATSQRNHNTSISRVSVNPGTMDTGPASETVAEHCQCYADKAAA